MDRMYEIEQFLNYFARIYLNNPDKRISSDSFYYELTLFGLTTEERMKKRDSNVNYTIRGEFFDNWMRHFQRNPNLNVYWTPNQGRFLQFNNSKNNDSECYKLYLSFPEDKMYECVKMVFEYIAANKMETFSKVADCIRSDSVILRMAKKEDAIRLMNYINNTPEISRHCKPTNPFLPRNGKVGIAYDRWMSFNSTLSFMLEKYFIEKRATATLDNVSASDFRQYVLRILNDIQSNKEALMSFMNESHVVSELSRLNWMSKAEIFSNIKDILDLITVGLDPNMRIEEYYRRIDTYMNPNHKRENCNKFDRVINSPERVIQNIEYSDDDIQLATQIVNAYVVYALKKYSTVQKYLNI